MWNVLLIRPVTYLLDIAKSKTEVPLSYLLYSGRCLFESVMYLSDTAEYAHKAPQELFTLYSAKFIIPTPLLLTMQSEGLGGCLLCTINYHTAWPRPLTPTHDCPLIAPRPLPLLLKLNLRGRHSYRTRFPLVPRRLQVAIEYAYRHRELMFCPVCQIRGNMAIYPSTDFWGCVKTWNMISYCMQPEDGWSNNLQILMLDGADSLGLLKQKYWGHETKQQIELPQYIPRGLLAQVSEYKHWSLQKQSS